MNVRHETRPSHIKGRFNSFYAKYKSCAVNDDEK